MTAERVLVIILSSILAVSLIVSIIAGILIIKLIKQLQRIINKTEGAVGEFASAASFVRNVAAPSVLAKTFASWFIKNVTKKRK